MQKLKALLKDKGYDEQLSELAPNTKDYFRFDHNKPGSGYFNIRHTNYGGKTYISALFGDHSLGEEFHYQSDMPVDPAECAGVRAAIEMAKKEESKEKLARQEKVSLECQALYNKLEESQTPHAYTAKKKIDSLWHVFEDTALCVPCADLDGKLWGIQRIYADGSKFFTPGQRVKGVMHVIGSIEEGKPIYVGEGYATCCSIYMSTSVPTVCAFNANNLSAVCEALHARFPRSPLTICADDDGDFSEDGKPKINVGIEAARKAAKLVGARVVWPKFVSAK